MPIPETPYTREEAYLNAIATGDSGGIPETPYTREEMYLDYIARNGSGGGGGGSSTLSGLTDVDISNPTDGQTLVYNATSGKWENGSGGGGSSGIIVVHVVEIAGTENVRLDKTWQEIWDAQTAGMIVAISEGQTGDSYAYWSCCPIPEVSCDTSYGIWTVVDGSNRSTFNCLAPTDYPQTGIRT